MEMMPQPPIEYTDEVKRAWTKYLPELIRINGYEAPDLILFGRFCWLDVEISKLQQRLQSADPILRRGVPMKNPDATLMLQYMDQWRHIARELGIGMLSREDLKKKKGQRGDQPTPANNAALRFVK